MPVLNEDMLNDLSSDQKYLYDIVHAIRSGYKSQDQIFRLKILYMQLGVDINNVRIQFW